MEFRDMQSIEEIEKWYDSPDPWGYEKNGDDIARKKKILDSLKGKRYTRALDIGCGEGWITKDFPADEIEGFEISENASKRFPKNVKLTTKPTGKYDLIVATGVMYEHYPWQQFIDIILRHGKGIVILSNIVEWEMDMSRLGTPILTEEYPYREFTQILRKYDLSLP